MKIIEIKEETKIPQEDGSVLVLEAGDKIKVLVETVEGDISSALDVVMGSTQDSRTAGIFFADGLYRALRKNSNISRLDFANGLISEIKTLIGV